MFSTSGNRRSRKQTKVHRRVGQLVFGSFNFVAVCLVFRNGMLTLNETEVGQSLAGASVANTEDCFIKLNVRIATASGWVQRLVRPVEPSSTSREICDSLQVVNRNPP